MHSCQICANLLIKCHRSWHINCIRIWTIFENLCTNTQTLMQISYYYHYDYDYYLTHLYVSTIWCKCEWMCVIVCTRNPSEMIHWRMHANNGRNNNNHDNSGNAKPLHIRGYKQTNNNNNKYPKTNINIYIFENFWCAFDFMISSIISTLSIYGRFISCNIVGIGRK